MKVLTIKTDAGVFTHPWCEAYMLKEKTLHVFGPFTFPFRYPLSEVRWWSVDPYYAQEGWQQWGRRVPQIASPGDKFRHRLRRKIAGLGREVARWLRGTKIAV